MLTNRQYLFASLSALLALAAVDRTSYAQHVHGRIELGIVVEDDVLAVALRAPLADVVGFEHEPGDDRQVARLRSAAALLADPERMFGTPESAGCVVRDTRIDGPDFLTALLVADAGVASQAAQPEHEHGTGHAEHEHESEHSDHEHEPGHDAHSEVEAEYSWACEDLSMVDTLEMRFVPGFESVDKIEVQIVSPNGARYAEITGETNEIALGRP